MLDTRTLVILAAALCGVASGGLLVRHFGPAASSQMASGGAKWVDAAWAFSRDGWPNGRGFECDAVQCGVKVSLYARMKRGFCSCETGVADDDEIDRVGDVDLVARDFKAIGAGEFRTIADTPGRIRLYRAGDAYVLSLASGKNCDAFVAMAVAKEPLAAKTAEAVTQFLNEPAFLKWVDGLR